MNGMDPTERVVRTLEGKSVDRIPFMSAGFETKTANDVLGKPLLSQETMMHFPLNKYLMDKFGPMLTRPFVQPFAKIDMERRVKAQAEFGFDAAWMLYEDTFILERHNRMIFRIGAIFDFLPDGFGNLIHMYREPAFKTPEEFDAWPYWPDPDENAHRTYKFFKKMMAQYGDKICIIGMGPAYGMHESMNWVFGIDKAPRWIRKHPEIVKRYLDFTEQLIMKTSMAQLDAGVPVIMHGDDMAFKTGPFMSPKMIEELFGERYQRIVKAIHDRGAKVTLHSCGNNTLLFDHFIRWGYDGLHAYENTSNVDIYNEKRIHGDQITMIGGLGIDYLLTEDSKDQEVTDKVRELAKKLGPGGRYIMSPVHSLLNISLNKLKVAIDALREYGRYPINND